MMKRWTTVACLACMSLGAARVTAQVTAQVTAREQGAKGHFIYIQNESGMPFYVKSAKGELLSSSPAGYIIIPHMQAARHALTIGFPKRQYPEEAFVIDLRQGHDAGYLLKATGEKTFVLYSLTDYKALKPSQVASSPGNRIVAAPPAEAPPATSPEVVPAPGAEPPVAQATPRQEDASSDDFSAMLNAVTGTDEPSPAPAEVASAPGETAPASGDGAQQPGLPPAQAPDLAGSTGQVEEAPAPEPSDTSGDADSGFLAQVAAITASRRARHSEAPKEPSPATNTDNSPEQASSAPSATPSSPTFITFPTDNNKAHTEPAAAPETAAAAADERLLSDEERRERRRLRKQQRQAAKDSLAALKEKEEALPEPPEETQPAEADKAPMANSDCQVQADEKDFQKARRKMASRSDEEGMFKMAEKFLGENRCYSAAQVQSLTYLFQSDEYRYRFLEMAYPKVYDGQHFPALEKALSSDYYRGRFRAMLKK